MPEVATSKRYVVSSAEKNAELHILSTDKTNKINMIVKSTASATWTGLVSSGSVASGQSVSIDMATQGTFIMVKTTGDLTGTVLTGDKPFNVHSGFSKSVIGSTTSSLADIGDDQLAPTSAWGKMYIIPPLPGESFAQHI